MENFTYYVKGTVIGNKECQNDGEVLQPADLAEFCEEINNLIKEDEYSNLAEYYDEGPGGILSIIPSVIVDVDGKLYSLTTIKADHELAAEEMIDMLDYLSGQFSDGWGEGFEQRSFYECPEEIECEEWDEEEQEYYRESYTETAYFYISFWYSEKEGREPHRLWFETPKKERIGEDGTSHLPLEGEPIVPVKPRCKLIGEDGNVFNLIGLTAKALKKAGQDERAKEMQGRVIKAGSYSEALAIMSEYVVIY